MKIKLTGANNSEFEWKGPVPPTGATLAFIAKHFIVEHQEFVIAGPTDSPRAEVVEVRLRVRAAD